LLYEPSSCGVLEEYALETLLQLQITALSNHQSHLIVPSLSALSVPPWL
jgi:hypothetical protein